MSQEMQIERHDVENTPFAIYVREDGKSRVAIGNNWVTPELNSKEEAKQTIEEKDWWLICNVIALYGDYAAQLAANLKTYNERKEVNNA